MRKPFLDVAEVWHLFCTWQLYFILVPSNEKKSIQLLQDMRKSPPLQGMRLEEGDGNAVSRAMCSACSRATLNEKQTLAVQRGLQRPFSMVQGPPGTGKTSFLVQFVAALLSAPRRRQGGRILVCAPSNHAADHLLDRLISAGTPPHYMTRVYSRFIERAHGSMYKGGTTRMERGFDIQPHLEEHALHWKVSEVQQVKFTGPPLSRDAFDRSYEASEVKVLKDSRIVITTCTTGPRQRPSVLRPVSFDTIVIDEAAQASEPDIVLPASGPVVTENNLCAPYVSALETPFLERMLQNPRRWLSSTMLNMQYRMHPSIRSFPSSQFYESKLEDQVCIPHRVELNCIWPDAKEHRSFVDCKGSQSMGLSPELNRTCDAALIESKVSLKNVGEAQCVVAACKALLRKSCSARDIAVITPYKAQQHEIRARLERDVGSAAASILVGTVHALQGSEREYIIVSFVRSISEDVEDVVSSAVASVGDSVALQELHMESLGILSDYKLLNVAITRAKYGLICVGNADVLSKGSKYFNAFIHSLRSCIVSKEEFLRSARWARGRISP
ncbi:Regulator of nonsense transcripts 1 (Up-frameshift suppressor 1 homolog) [Durusdinium trenchii]|uniref:Regulator of nonsense transcripts 1 (Up-frameshift suppressor 1 homolog) n=1 Tax=Durusdinium trenchii TaxID=1381693 RepID=A0ABP0M3D3_9DINO